LGKQEKVPRRRAREPASNSIAPARRSCNTRENKKPVADEIRSCKEEQEEKHHTPAERNLKQ